MIVKQDLGRARYCMYQAAQLFQHFRTIKALSHIDTLSLLVSMLYMLLYIELFVSKGVKQDHLGSQSDNSTTGMKILRLDSLNHVDEVEGWLSLRHHCRLHIAGIGLLDAPRSPSRVCKEASSVMANSASSSNLASALSAMLMSLAVGDVPEFGDSQ